TALHARTWLSQLSGVLRWSGCFRSEGDHDESTLTKECVSISRCDTRLDRSASVRAALPGLSEPRHPDCRPLHAWQRLGCPCAPHRTKDERKLAATGCGREPGWRGHYPGCRHRRQGGTRRLHAPCELSCLCSKRGDLYEPAVRSWQGLRAN